MQTIHLKAQRSITLINIESTSVSSPSPSFICFKGGGRIISNFAFVSYNLISQGHQLLVSLRPEPNNTPKWQSNRAQIIIIIIIIRSL